MRISFFAGCVLLFVLLLAGCTQRTPDSAPQNPLATAAETVSIFCEMDGDAVRMTSETWSRILPYIAWTEEAGWDRTVVIERFRIVRTENRSDALAMITVEYDVAGELSQSYQPGKKKERIVFTVLKTDAGWKIKDPDFMPPHVMMKPLIKHLRETKRLEIADQIR